MDSISLLKLGEELSSETEERLKHEPDSRLLLARKAELNNLFAILLANTYSLENAAELDLNPKDLEDILSEQVEIERRLIALQLDPNSAGISGKMLK